MEFAKKMVLVPSESVEKLQQGPVSTDPMDALHSGMTQILKSRSLDDAEKWSRYQQILQRLLHHADQRRKPFTFTIDEGIMDRGNPTDQLETVGTRGHQSRREYDIGIPMTQSFQDVLSTVPITFRPKGSVLLDKLKRSNLINWEDDGRVQIENRLIPGANITDLVNDALRHRKTASKPAGADEFYKLLAKLNVPQELIGNSERWNAIRRYALGLASPGSPILDTLWPETPSVKSTGARPKDKRARKLDWEPFSFS